MVDTTSMRQVGAADSLSYCGKKGHPKRDCWKWQQERGGKGDSKGKSKIDGKGKDRGKHSAGKAMKRASIKGMATKMMEVFPNNYCQSVHSDNLKKVLKLK